ncbi:unnamed protein product [Meloidogyne enterolobii]|uniref:Uncharacterized protein n=1 Tax=Meloidogyne enterolobii TaxID=390850 RepID=A0ACB0XK97_MELEN
MIKSMLFLIPLLTYQQNLKILESCLREYFISQIAMENYLWKGLSHFSKNLETTHLVNTNM